MRKHVLACLAILLFLAGCTNSENIDMKNSAPALTEEQLTELFEQYDCGEAEWQAPTFDGDYAPAETEESGLYQKLPFDETVPYEKIEVRAFGNGKIIYSYMTEKFGVNGGGEDYDAGRAVIYDIKTEEFIAGDIFSRGIFWSGERIFAGNSCYYINHYDKCFDRYSLIRLDLTTGSIKQAEEYPENFWLGYFAKLDSDRFAVVSEHSGQIDLFDAAENQSTLFFTSDTSNDVKISSWNQQLYIFYNENKKVILESGRFVKGPLESTIAVPYVNCKDPDTGEEKEYELKQTIHVQPGTEISDLLRGRNYSFHTKYFANGWYVFEENTASAILFAEGFYGGSNNITGMAQNTGISYYWDTDHILYSVDVSTGKMWYLDFGYREKQISFFNDENGNVLISLAEGYGADAAMTGVYFIPASTIRSESISYSAEN